MLSLFTDSSFFVFSEFSLYRYTLSIWMNEYHSFLLKKNVLNKIKNYFIQKNNNNFTPSQDKNNKFRVRSQILNSYFVGQWKYQLYYFLTSRAQFIETYKIGLNVFSISINMLTFRFSPSIFFPTFNPPKVFHLYCWPLLLSKFICIIHIFE